MKMRKLFAGVAAAATMLAGLTIGVTTANAAEDDPITLDTGTPATITVNAPADDQSTTDVDENASLNGHTFVAIRLASYDDAVYGANDATAKSVSLLTESALVSDIETVLNDVIADSITPTYENSEFTDNPMGYVAKYMLGYKVAGNTVNRDETSKDSPYAGALRDFVTALAGKATFQSEVTKGTYTATGANGKAEFTNLPQGVYAVVDTTDLSAASADVAKFTTSIPMLLGTKIYPQGDVTGLDLANQSDLGIIQVKNEPTPVEKTVDESSQSVGKDVTWTVTGKVPNVTGYDTYTYTLTDTPGVGQDVKLDASSLSLTVKESKESTGTLATLNYGTDFTVKSEGEDTTGYEANGSTTFVVTVSNDWLMGLKSTNSSLVGKTFVLTYKATINSAAIASSGAVGEIVNDVEVNNNGSTNEDGDKTYTYNFQFTKVDADGTGIEGAEFKIKNSAGTFLTQNADSKAWTEAASEADATVFTSGAKGVVSFTGLAAGEYTVVETKAADGFFQSALPTFTVTITQTKDGTGAVTGYTITFGEDAVWDLVTPTDNGTADATATVKNVKSITQLPLTGGAGIALFSVIGLLLAGAAATVYVKMRGVKQASRA